MNAPLIVCFTSSGFTARTVASYRPAVPIFAVTPEPETFRQLALVWGVVPALVQHMPTYDSMVTVARHKLLELGLAEPLLPWHANRQRVAELAAALAAVAGAAAKVGHDLVLLAQTEVGEVADESGGRSSTMPQKRNPVRATIAVALSGV